MLKYTIVALALIHTALSLKCYVQKDYLKADGTELKECTSEEARKLNTYVKTAFPSFDSKESPDFKCLDVTVRLSKDDDWSHLKTCGFKSSDYCKLKDDAASKEKIDACKTCEDDGCNPAGRPVASFGVIVLLGLAAVLAKFH